MFHLNHTAPNGDVLEARAFLSLSDAEDSLNYTFTLAPFERVELTDSEGGVLDRVGDYVDLMEGSNLYVRRMSAEGDTLEQEHFFEDEEDAWTYFNSLTPSEGTPLVVIAEDDKVLARK